MRINSFRRCVVFIHSKSSKVWHSHWFMLNHESNVVYWSPETSAYIRERGASVVGRSPEASIRVRGRGPKARAQHGQGTSAVGGSLEASTHTHMLGPQIRVSINTWTRTGDRRSKTITVEFAVKKIENKLLLIQRFEVDNVVSGNEWLNSLTYINIITRVSKVNKITT